MKHKKLVEILEIVGPILVKILMGTLRIKEYRRDIFIKARRQYGTVIYAFWHNRMLIPAYTHINQNVHVLVSQHRDGEIISRIISKLGFSSIRGSSRRGGLKALKEAIDVMKRFDVAITPDGPTGPKEIAKEGVLYLAYKTGKPIIPGTFLMKNKWELNSWDNFQIPKPFSPVKMIYGNPIFVKDKGEITEKLKELQREFEQYC